MAGRHQVGNCSLTDFDSQLKFLIKMYFKEHGIPHFHALYAEYNGVFEIESLEMIEGDLPNRAQRMVKEWAEL